MSGDGTGLGADPTDAPGDGLPGGVGEPGGEPDFAAAAAATRGMTTGCSMCGFTGGECFSQDPTTCPSAKALAREREVAAAELSGMAQGFEPPPHAEMVKVWEEQTGQKFIPLGPEPEDQGGVWVTYCADEKDRYDFRVHSDELTALRHAVGHQAAARFLKWGEEL